MKANALARALVALSLTVGGCGGGSGTSVVEPTIDGSAFGAASNSLPVLPTVDVPAPASNVLRVSLSRGPNNSAFNAPYVSITVCAPATQVCQTLDHVLLDTGSVGLRIAASALRADLGLPPVTAGGSAIGECMQFASGYAWGSLRLADLRMAGERAASVPVHLIDDTAPLFVNAPAACTRSGINLMRLLDAKAVLGIGLRRQDCGAACAASGAPGIYFACSATGCVPTPLAVDLQAGNPVAALERNNNGVVIVLPQVPMGGSREVDGALVFGVGTQPNNQLGSSRVFDVDKSGGFVAAYKGGSYRSFLDTGSNALYFPDADLPRCATYFCPFFATGLSATVTSPRGITRNIDFLIDSLYGLQAGAVAAHTAGSDDGALARNFDWGLPFFFGRAVHLVIQDAPTPAGNGPFWAW